MLSNDACIRGKNKYKLCVSDMQTSDFALFISLLSAVKSVNLSYDGFKVSTYVKVIIYTCTGSWRRKG